MQERTKTKFKEKLREKLAYNTIPTFLSPSLIKYKTTKIQNTKTPKQQHTHLDHDDDEARSLCLLVVYVQPNNRN